MAGIIDIDNISIYIYKLKHCDNTFTENDDRNCHFYVGELVNVKLSCKLTEESRSRFQQHLERSPTTANLLADIKQKLDVKTVVSGIRNTNGRTAMSMEFYNLCPIQRCEVDHDERNNCKIHEAFLTTDKLSYILPLQVRIPDLPSDVCNAKIQVQVLLSSKPTPSWLSRPTILDPLMVGDQPKVEKDKGRIVSQIVKIKQPPQILQLQNRTSNPEIIALQVKNVTGRKLEVTECSVMPESCPKSAPGSQLCTYGHKGRCPCAVHTGMVKMVPTKNSVLPCVLHAGECLSVCYNICLQQYEANITKDDVALEAHLKWKFDDQNSDSQEQIKTTYRLHSLKFRQGLFVMSAICEEGPIKVGESFTVDYTIHNRLQDFLSIKLYWDPVLRDSSIESARNFDKVRTCLICEDPSVQLGMCLYGDTVKAKVSFCAVAPGLYEVCQNMKISLRYLIPGSEEGSVASPTSQTSTQSDDHLAVAPEPVWRARTASGSSFNIQRPVPEEWQMSSADKSYSFGDLAPENTPDTELFVDSKPMKSPPLPRRDPKLIATSAAKYEQILLSPGNFMKNSCLIKVN